MATQKTFFNSAHMLANVFTEPREQGKFMAGTKYFEGEEYYGCMKPMEYFMTDITRNLQEWAYNPGKVKEATDGLNDGAIVFYKTKKRWYMFEVEGNLVKIACFHLDMYGRLDTWMNLSSVDSYGKSLLEKHPEKRVALFNS